MVELHALALVGTRAEAIQQAPVVWAMKARPDRFRVTLVSTGRPPEMLAPMFELLRLKPDVTLDLGCPDRVPDHLIARWVSAIDCLFGRELPDVVIVQGYSTTAISGAIASLYRSVPLALVHAGLWGDPLDDPVPEPARSRVVERFSRWLFAPSAEAAERLRREGVPETVLTVSGDTVVDALSRVRDRLVADDRAIDGVPPEALRGDRRVVLVDSHGREPFADGVAELAAGRPDLVLVHTASSSPGARAPIDERLGRLGNVRPIEPQPYDRFLRLLAHANLVLTDSDGVWREALSLRVPSLRWRPDVVAAARAVLDHPEVRASMAFVADRLADGHAGERIAEALWRGIILGQGASHGAPR